MKIYNLVVMLYIWASAVIGVALLYSLSPWFTLSDLMLLLTPLYTTLEGRIRVGIAGTVLILLAFLFTQITSSRREREKTIGFNNPTGQVTITLFAVEDLIRKIGQEFHQIKEIRPDVIYSKKRGLQVNIRLILKSEANIPEFTAQLQEMVKSRIEDVLGTDEPIAIKIHIAKMLIQPERPKKKNDAPAEEQNIPIPYQHM